MDSISRSIRDSRPENLSSKTMLHSLTFKVRRVGKVSGETSATFPQLVIERRCTLGNSMFPHELPVGPVHFCHSGIWSNLRFLSFGNGVTMVLELGKLPKRRQRRALRAVDDAYARQFMKGGITDPARKVRSPVELDPEAF
ncbi:histidine biosynthesis bifunctional protein HisIE [Striga asiatica]|uniref:Histidine biosynthesis bifunctional protein HisIE n=1 Tax=Striga asiatica TaxID=4170 RepID=A0A5A7QE30_STRAF|nr:histidine biosynthesis bifunctional protein HisIE [Striga asiatica]